MDLCEGLCRPPRPLIKPQDWPLAVTGAASAQHRLAVEPQDWPLVVVAATSAQHPRCRWSNLRIGLSEKDATGKAFGLAPDPATRLGSTAAGGYLGFCPLGLGRGGLAWPWLWPWKCTCWEAPWDREDRPLSLLELAHSGTVPPASQWPPERKKLTLNPVPRT